MGQKKYRDKTGLFVAEGPKLVGELIQAAFSPHSIFTTEPSTTTISGQQEISEAELKKVSFLKTPNKVLGIFHKPAKERLENTDLTVVLDDIQDPGNLGTIIRLCDWFGVAQLVCSPKTADCYNPKVIQATMGSIARVRVEYHDLEMYLSNVSVPVYGAFMDGNDVYGQSLPQKAIVVLGNEGQGISAEIESRVTRRIAIPQYGKAQAAESLNVATAGAILLSEFRRATGK